MVIPDYLQSLVQLPEKNWPDKRWGARGLVRGKEVLVYAATPELALLNLAEAVKNAGSVTTTSTTR